GNPEGYPGGRAHGRRDHRPRTRLCADADGGPWARFNAPAQPDPRLERGFLDAESLDLERGAAHRLHRFLFEPGRVVLGQALGGFDARDRTNSRPRLVQSAAARPRPDLRRRQIGKATHIMGQITLQGVQKSFGPVHIIKGADLDIADGSFVVFVGPSGCGKTTLLRLIAGLEDVTGGNILIDGKDVVSVPPAKRGLSMVFQSYALYPHMSVRGNIAFGLKMAGLPKPEINRKVEAAAATLNLTPYLDRKPRELSGGQRQRVAIGRAIVREPKAF